MTTTVKNLLLCGLAEYMRGMRDVEARQLAHDLTLRVSESITRTGQSSGNVAINLPCFPREVWNQLTVGVPWEAYGQAHGLRGQDVMISSVKALFSAPAALDDILNVTASNNGLWGGSLLVALGRLLGGAKHEPCLSGSHTDYATGSVIRARRGTTDSVQVCQPDRQGMNLSFFPLTGAPRVFDRSWLLPVAQATGQCR